LIGKLVFADAAEKDTLKSYQIKLYNEKNELLTDSRILYSNGYSNVNEFNYTFEYDLKESESYYFTFEYETENMYKEIDTYNFTVMQESADKLEAEMTVILDDINACMGIHLEGEESQESFIGNITIRRASSESNFTI
jgi:hypothetical protein